MVRAQIERDDNVRQLFAAMDDLYTDVQIYVKETKRDELLLKADVLSNISRQTTECCIFVREYCNPSFGNLEQQSLRRHRHEF